MPMAACLHRCTSLPCRRHPAATRWTHGAEREIVILDAAGRVIKTVGRAHAVNNAPSWAADDRMIYFTSDRSGRSALYRATVSDGSLVRIAESATGLFENEPSPDGTQLATLQIGRASCRERV